MSLFKSTKNQSASAAASPAQTPRPSVDAQRPAAQTTKKMTIEQALDSVLHKTVQTMPSISTVIALKLSKLIRILLHSMPDGHVSTLLRVAYLSESSEPGHQQTVEATTKIIPYYSFVTSVGVKPSYRLPFTILLGVDAGFRDYLKRYGHTRRYLLECSVKDDLAYKSYDWRVQYPAGQELCRDLTWALSMDTERVKTLSVPLSDIARYLPLVSRFEVLADVTFLLDRNTRPAGDWQQSATLEQQEAWKMLQIERLQQLEAMILFTQEHRRRHPGVLATGRLKLKESAYEEDGPEEYQLRLLKSLPPLNKAEPVP
ncbi:hypothetical protein KI688_007134 [Linnemannia hyalina]|uniref:Uncharacterized protein n=1 Tax=Linnemannia hyalina TaxID=64524 RepID=A0A9P8BMU3_9FUNG|nr:hypothetical protein KI688_007134 [Linnemannia hyalina]